MTKQDDELLYLRWFYQELRHTVGKGLEAKFTSEMGVAVPEKYEHKSSIDYVSKKTARRKQGGRHYGGG